MQMLQGSTPRGEKYGLYAEALGAASDVGVFSPDYVDAEGYRSKEDTFWWIDTGGLERVDNIGLPGSFDIDNYYKGGVILRCNTPGNEYFELPLSTPGVVFGQNVRVEEVRIYYEVSDPATYVDRTDVYKFNGVDDYEKIGSNPIKSIQHFGNFLQRSH